MKAVYAIKLIPNEPGYIVDVPDFGISTEGEDYYDAIYMARDAIGVTGITLEDMGEEIPKPSNIDDIECNEGEMLTLVDIDFDLYRRRQDSRSVRRNVTLPNWLNAAAEQSGVNVSAILQEALKKELHLQH